MKQSWTLPRYRPHQTGSSNMKMALNYYLWSWLQAFITMISEPAKTNSAAFSNKWFSRRRVDSSPTKKSEQNEWKQALSFSRNGFSFCKNIQWKKEKVLSMEDKSSSSLEKKKTFIQQINADNTSHSLSSHLEHRRSSHTCAHTHTHTKSSSCCHLHHMRAVLMAGIERRQTLLEVVITVGEQLHRSDKRCDVDSRHFGWHWEGLVPKFTPGTKKKNNI